MKWVIAAGAVALVLAGCGSASSTAQAPVPPAPPATKVAPSPAPILTTTCGLGWLVAYDENNGGFWPVKGAGFYPDNAAGLFAADKAQASLSNQYGSQVGGPTAATGAEVKIANTSGHGVLLSGFTVETDDPQGTMVTQHQISSGFDLPRFLAPGEADSFLLNFANLAGAVNVSTNSYLHGSCKVARWQ